MKLSVIIPTLNEQDYIRDTLINVRDKCADVDQLEIIVVDAGSKDRTTIIATELGVQVFVKPEFKRLKYKSLNYGAKKSAGTNLLFLDADCTVPQDFDLAIASTLQENNVVGGAFEFKMQSYGSGGFIGTMVYWIVELANRMRYRMTKLYFGDQGVFCDRNAFDAVGGYPTRPLMESAYFCRLLTKQGKLKLVSSPLVSSIRRFQTVGMFSILWKDFWVWVQFWLGRDISQYADRYWSENEKTLHNPKD